MDESGLVIESEEAGPGAAVLSSSVYRATFSPYDVVPAPPSTGLAADTLRVTVPRLPL